MTAPDRSFGANEHASALTAVRAHPEVVGLLLAVAALAWWLTAVRMAGMDIGPGSDLGGLGWFAVVWMVMTAAMMLPSFAPAAAVYSAITVRHPSRPLLFTGGYLLVWSVAGVGGWLLFDAVKHLLAGQLAWRGGGRPAAVGVLALAAMYQLTPAKRACLGRCRTPLRCIRPRRRDLVSGALISGVRAGGGAVPSRPAARHRAAGCALSGVTAVEATLPTTVFLLDSGLESFGSPWPAAGVTALRTSGALDLGVRSGTPGAFRGRTVAISTALAVRRHVRVGAVLDARLADGTPARLRVGAVFDRALGLGDVLLPMPLAVAHAAVRLDSAIFLAGAPGLGGPLRALIRAVPTLAVLARVQYLDTVRAANQTSAWIVWLLVALIGSFTGLSVINTSVMAIAERQSELALVRMIGATRRQARCMIAWEAATTTLVAVGFGALTAALAVSVSMIVEFLIALIGLGIAIDYSLLVIVAGGRSAPAGSTTSRRC